MNLFAAVEMAPRDPILGLNETYLADIRANKVNLGVGVYFTEEGKIPLLKAVQIAEKQRVEGAMPRGYLPIDGIATYNQAVQRLMLGKNAPLIAENRIATVQALGGTGALKIGADFLKYLLPKAHVAISDPSWENHRALFETAGFNVSCYRYYNATTHGLDFAGMLDSLQALPNQSIIVLHACCHNPTGVDLNTQQWQQVIEVVKAKSHIPFIDMAYQGFAEGIDEDNQAVRLFAQAGLSFLIASSFSKSFSLYGERVGALSICTQDSNETARVLSQLKRIVRTNYSNPPTHGATIVSQILNTPELHQLWEEELNSMRKRIKLMRNTLVDLISAQNKQYSFEFVNQQRGMFSYSGLNEKQVETLREQYGIYAVSTGRICVAALNQRNIEYVANALVKVLS